MVDYENHDVENEVDEACDDDGEVYHGDILVNDDEDLQGEELVNDDGNNHVEAFASKPHGEAQPLQLVLHGMDLFRLLDL